MNYLQELLFGSFVLRVIAYSTNCIFFLVWGAYLQSCGKHITSTIFLLVGASYGLTAYMVATNQLYLANYFVTPLQTLLAILIVYSTIVRIKQGVSWIF